MGKASALFRGALRPTLKTVLWLLKLMLPITLVVSVLSFYGVMGYISGFFSPVFEFFGLSGDASIVFVSSVFANIYSAIAVIAGLSLDIREVTILATMCLISHNLIIETKIQQKTGSSAVSMVVLRIAMSFAAAWLLNLVLPRTMEGALILQLPGKSPATIWEVIKQWGWVSLNLMAKVVVIIYGLNLLQRVLIEYRLMPVLTRVFSPVMRLMGLPRSTTLAWIIANTLGLAYGGAAIREEVEKGAIIRKDAQLLNTSVAVNHSLIEDTLLFVAIGVSLFWAIAPRFVLAIIAVWVQRLIRIIKKKPFYTKTELAK